MPSLSRAPDLRRRQKWLCLGFVHRSCVTCGVRCPQRADLGAWRRATGSLDLDDLAGPLGEPPRLPSLVPVIDLEELRDWGVARHWPAWALSLTEAHSQRTGAVWRSWASGAGAAEARRAGARTLVLTGVASDQLLAAAWPRLSRGDSVTGLDLVVAPAWSIYFDDPRLLVTWNQIPSEAP
jgi:hypothetical protein